MDDGNTRPAAGRWQGLRRWAARGERWFWPALIAAVLFLQWPMLKGLYYRTADASPRASSIAWQTDLDAALEESRRSGRLVFVDFSADWCPPCIVMKHDVWPDPAVERAMLSFVPVLVDVDSNQAVAERYGVQGIPTILVLDSTGRVVRRASYLSAAALVRFLAETQQAP